MIIKIKLNAIIIVCQISLSLFFIKYIFFSEILFFVPYIRSFSHNEIYVVKFVQLLKKWYDNSLQRVGQCTLHCATIIHSNEDIIMHVVSLAPFSSNSALYSTFFIDFIESYHLCKINACQENTIKFFHVI